MARLPLGVVILVSLVYVVLGHRYANYWRSDSALWTYAAKVTPLNPAAVVNHEIVSHRAW